MQLCNELFICTFACLFQHISNVNAGCCEPDAGIKEILGVIFSHDKKDIRGILDAMEAAIYEEDEYSKKLGEWLKKEADADRLDISKLEMSDGELIKALNASLKHKNEESKKLWAEIENSDVLHDELSSENMETVHCCVYPSSSNRKRSASG